MQVASPATLPFVTESQNPRTNSSHAAHAWRLHPQRTAVPSSIVSKEESSRARDTLLAEPADVRNDGRQDEEQQASKQDRADGSQRVIVPLPVAKRPGVLHWQIEAVEQPHRGQGLRQKLPASRAAVATSRE